VAEAAAEKAAAHMMRVTLCSTARAHWLLLGWMDTIGEENRRPRCLARLAGIDAHEQRGEAAASVRPTLECPADSCRAAGPSRRRSD